MVYPIRVLHVLNGLGTGGAEAFIMNIYRNIDRNKVQFDFLLRSSETSFLEKEVKSLGGKIFITSAFPKHFFRNYQEIKCFFEEHLEYKIVHIHANSLMYMSPLMLAKKKRIPVRIIHSHNTQAAKGILALWIHYFNRKRISKYANYFLGCSESACEWMYDKELNYQVINNGINIEKFQFDEYRRKTLRKRLNIDTRYVIGHVGRFVRQKNHKFLLEIFKEILLIRKDSILLLIGDGSEKEKIKKKAEKLKIDKKIIFISKTNEIENYMSAMDTFLFPSLFEGLGIVLIEAQANGLPCLSSEEIPDEARCTNLLYTMPLSNSAKEWAQKAITLNNRSRVEENIKMVKRNYDIKEIAAKLECFYLEKINS